MADGRCITAKAVLVLVSMTALATRVEAEVGVIVADEGGLGTGYVFQTIIDETEPVGIAWTPFFPAGPHRSILNPLGAENQDGPPSIILGSGPGLPVVSWSRNSPDGYDVVVSRFENGAWTPAQVVADSPLDELDPYLVRDPADGSFHVLYWVADAIPRVEHRQAPADLSSWSQPVPVSHPADVAARPSGAFHDGLLRVAYERHDLGYGLVPREIVVATGDGQTFTSEVVATTHFAGANWPQVHSANGELWVDWIHGQTLMGWSKRAAPADWDPVAAEVFESAEERDFHVRGLIRTLVLD